MLYWRGKNKSTFKRNTSKELISSRFNIYVFTRTDNKNTQFTYQGLGYVAKVEDTSPITIYWRFKNQIRYEKDTIHEEEIYEANVISLCVVCHKKLHLANIDEKVDIIKRLHKKRIERLRQCGIDIELEELIKLY